MTERKRLFTAYAFNQYLREKKLMASRCVQCDKVHLPVRAICPDCQRDEIEWVELSGEGKLAAFTAVHIGPTFMNAQGFDRNKPYLTGVVALKEGVKISARILGLDANNPSEIEIGTPMTVKFLELGEGENSCIQLAFQAIST